jgi:hypothetical protein
LKLSLEVLEKSRRICPDMRFLGRRMCPNAFSAFHRSQNIPCIHFLRFLVLRMCPACVFCVSCVFLAFFCVVRTREGGSTRSASSRPRRRRPGGRASERAGDGGSVPARSNSMCSIPSLTHRWIQKVSNPCTWSCCGNTDRISRNNYICVRSRPRAATRQDLPHSERAGWWICMHRYTLQWNHDIRHLWGDVISALCYAWIEIVVNFVFTVTASPSAFATPLFSPDFAVSR